MNNTKFIMQTQTVAWILALEAVQEVFPKLEPILKKYKLDHATVGLAAAIVAVLGETDTDRDAEQRLSALMLQLQSMSISLQGHFVLCKPERGENTDRIKIGFDTTTSDLVNDTEFDDKIKKLNPDAFDRLEMARRHLEAKRAAQQPMSFEEFLKQEEQSK